MTTTLELEFLESEKEWVEGAYQFAVEKDQALTKGQWFRRLLLQFASVGPIGPGSGLPPMSSEKLWAEISRGNLRDSAGKPILVTELIEIHPATCGPGGCSVRVGDHLLKALMRQAQVYISLSIKAGEGRRSFERFLAQNLVDICIEEVVAKEGAKRRAENDVLDKEERVAHDSSEMDPAFLKP